MRVDKAGREDWIVGALALLLMIDLLELPWYRMGGGMVSGILLPSVSNTATGPPAAFIGVLAVLASLAVLLDLLVEHLSPDRDVPSIKGSRTLTRHALAIAAAVLIALKFVLHLTLIGNLAVGFWFGVVLAAALVYATTRARRHEPPARARTDAPARAQTDAPATARTDAPATARTDAPATPRTDAPARTRTDAPEPATHDQLPDEPGEPPEDGERREQTGEPESAETTDAAKPESAKTAETAGPES